MRKKLSLFLGALGGAMVGYVFSKKSLRQELRDAKSAEKVAQILKKHLQKDGRKLGKEFKALMESEEVKSNLAKAKRIAREYINDAKKEVKGVAKKQGKRVKRAVKKRVTRPRKRKR